MVKYSVVIVDDHTLLSQAIAGMVNAFINLKFYIRVKTERNWYINFLLHQIIFQMWF